MRPLRLLLLAAGGSGLLASCSPPEPQRDVAFYRDHPDDRAAEMTTCRNDRGKLAATPNCINALAADGEAASRRFWATPKPVSRVQRPGAL